MAVAVLLANPVVCVLALPVIALAVPMDLGTGTGVSLNLSVLWVALGVGVWAFSALVRRVPAFARSAVNPPLSLFVASSMLSLVLGNVLWDPSVPRSDTFWLVQLTQWGVFFLSACAFWLCGNLVRQEHWLKRLVWIFLLVGGGLAALRGLPGFGSLARRVTTVAFIRAPLWTLLAGVAGGQLLFGQNSRLATLFLWGVMALVGVNALVLQREGVSNWTGVVAVWSVLLWLRFPRLRWIALVVLIALAIAGFLIPSVYEFAGGEAEWIEERGLQDHPRHTGDRRHHAQSPLWPWARGLPEYAALQPLRYRNTVWLEPQVSAHNNYIDIFSHTGLVGLGLFLWFLLEVARLGLKLRRVKRSAFAEGYIAGMLATLAGMVVIMMLADWFLPFVYNIGLPGFQASVLVWLFLGGLVALENMPQDAQA